MDFELESQGITTSPYTPESNVATSQPLIDSHSSLTRVSIKEEHPEDGNSKHLLRQLPNPSATSLSFTLPNSVEDEALTGLLIQESNNIGTNEQQGSLVVGNGTNLYCTACERTFSRKDTYRHHLRTVHKRTLTPCTTIRHPVIILPDEDDPNFNCKACKKTFTQRSSYRYHLEKVHKMLIVPKKTRDSIYLLPGQKHDPDLYCKPCKKAFLAKNGLLLHLKRIHKTKLPVPNPHLEPDIDDPNFYCRACEKTFNQRPSYLYHLRKTHGISINSRFSIPNPHLLPDVHDPYLYCRACERSYTYKHTYYTHLRKIHNMNFTPPPRTPPLH